LDGLHSHAPDLTNEETYESLARSVELTGKDMHYVCKVQTCESGIAQPFGRRILC